MSLIGSLLALVVFPLKAKLKPADPLSELRAGNVALEYWRNAYDALEKENERLRQDLQSARNDRDLVRAELRELMVQKDPASPYYRHGGFAQAQQALRAQQQASLQQQSYQGLGQLQQSYGDYQAAMQNYAGCTCVPARAQAFSNENAHRQEG